MCTIRYVISQEGSRVMRTGKESRFLPRAAICIALLALVSVGWEQRSVGGKSSTVPANRQSAPQIRPQAKPKIWPSKRQVGDDRTVESKNLSYGRLIPAKTLTPEEEEFAKIFAHELVHATAVVAANPTLSFPEKSIAGRIRKIYLDRSATERTAMQRRSRTLLSSSAAERQRHFGTFADAGTSRHRRRYTGFDAETKAMLNKAVNARLDAQLGQINQRVQNIPRGNYPVVTKTWLVAGFFKEVQSEPKQAMTLSEPVPIDFRWNTEEEANRVVWQLLRPASPGQAEVILASGVSNDIEGSDIRGFFTIDLRKYLPPVPAANPVNYYVRVLPQQVLKNSRITRGPSRRVIVSEPEEPTGVGPWSSPVIITYAKPGKNQWGETIDEPHEVYRKVQFFLDSLEIVDDQYGPGDEEFHLAGFIQESFVNSNNQGKRIRFGPFFAKLPGTVGADHEYANNALAEFHLNNPDQPEWPRSYICVISIMEEDDGGSLADWESELWSISDDILSSEIGRMVRDYLEDYRDELIKRGVTAAADIAQFIATTASAASASIVGMVIAFAAEIIVSIVTEMPDDFYGVEAYSLVLPFNLSNYIEELNGHFLVDGKYELSESIRFYGRASAASGSPIDGIVDVNIDWRFGEKDEYVGKTVYE